VTVARARPRASTSPAKVSILARRTANSGSDWAFCYIQHPHMGRLERSQSFSHAQIAQFCAGLRQFGRAPTAEQIGGSRSLPAATPGSRVDGFLAVAGLAAIDGQTR
jgi:hypothetical protein